MPVEVAIDVHKLFFNLAIPDALAADPVQRVAHVEDLITLLLHLLRGRRDLRGPLAFARHE
eukprot:151604-Lingulodinium_polyedra.AAC.1